MSRCTTVSYEDKCTKAIYLTVNARCGRHRDSYKTGDAGGRIREEQHLNAFGACARRESRIRGREKWRKKANER